MWDFLGDERVQGAMAALAILGGIASFMWRHRECASQVMQSASDKATNWIKRQVDSILTKDEWGMAIGVIIYLTAITYPGGVQPPNEIVRTMSWTGVLGVTSWLLIRSLYSAKKDIRRLRETLDSHYNWMAQAADRMTKQEKREMDSRHSRLESGGVANVEDREGEDSYANQSSQATISNADHQVVIPRHVRTE